MGKSKQPFLRSEDGKREIADTMHSKYNKQLQCPACESECSISGAFNKDSGGTPDENGRLYRRFKCRARPGCRKTLGVTELLALCQKLVSSTSLDQVPAVTSSGIVYFFITYFIFKFILHSITFKLIVFFVYIQDTNIFQMMNALNSRDNKDI